MITNTTEVPEFISSMISGLGVGSFAGSGEWVEKRGRKLKSTERRMEFWPCIGSKLESRLDLCLKPELSPLASGHIKTQNAEGPAFILGCKRWPLLPGSPPGCVRTCTAQSADLQQWVGRGCTMQWGRLPTRPTQVGDRASLCASQTERTLTRPPALPSAPSSAHWRLASSRLLGSHQTGKSKHRRSCEAPRLEHTAPAVRTPRGFSWLEAEHTHSSWKKQQ